jgi:hypothetical protein
VFIVLCVIFPLVKLYHCCCNFGLVENHKEIGHRGSLDAKTFQNCKEAAKTPKEYHSWFSWPRKASCEPKTLG